MSYLEMALEVIEERGRRAGDAKSGYEMTLPESSSQRDGVAPCGSPHCAGCYDVGNGKKIHPPKCGQDYLEWLKRWEAKGKVQ